MLCKEAECSADISGLKQYISMVHMKDYKCCSAEEIFEIIESAHGIDVFQSKKSSEDSVFLLEYTKMQLGCENQNFKHPYERLSIMTQLFMALVNVDQFNRGKTEADFGQVLDRNMDLAMRLISKIQNIMSSEPKKDDVEREVMKFVNEFSGLFGFKKDCLIDEEDMQRIVIQFRTVFSTVVKSPHFDEFIIKDQCEGDWVGFNGKMATDFASFVYSAFKDLNMDELMKGFIYEKAYQYSRLVQKSSVSKQDYKLTHKPYRAFCDEQMVVDDGSFRTCLKGVIDQSLTEIIQVGSKEGVQQSILAAVELLRIDFDASLEYLTDLMRDKNEEKIALIFESDLIEALVNASDSSGKTALMLCAETDSLIPFILLITSHSWCYQTDAVGKSALDYAKESRSEKILTCFNVIDDFLTNIRSNNYESIDKFFRHEGQKNMVDFIDEHDRTPLQYAILQNNTELFQLLLEKGANVNGNRYNPSTLTPLINSIEVYHKNSIFFDRLIELGVDVGAIKQGSGAFARAAVMGEGDFELVLRTLADKGVDVNESLCREFTLLDSIDVNVVDRDSILNRVVELVRLGVYFDQRDNSGCTMKDIARARSMTKVDDFLSKVDDFFQAVLEGNEFDMVYFSLSGIPLNARNNKGDTALMVAVRSCPLKTVLTVIEQGCCIYSKDASERQPLQIAIELQKLEVVNLIQLNMKFLSACVEDTKVALELLKERGVSVDVRDAEGKTPLMIAVEMDNYELVCNLLKRGANIFAEDYSGRLIEDFSTKNSDSQVMTILKDVINLFEQPKKISKERLSELREDGYLCVKDSWGRTPAFHVSSRGELHFVSEFIEHAEDRDKEGFTPFLAAVSKGMIECVSVYLEKKPAFVSQVHCLTGHTALIMAVASGNFDLVNLILKHNVDVNLKDYSGNSALHFSAENGSVEIMRQLIARGGNIESRDSEQGTPLLISVFNNNHDLARFLIAEGADITVVDVFDHSVGSLASRSDDQGFVDEVLHHIKERRVKSLRTSLAAKRIQRKFRSRSRLRHQATRKIVRAFKRRNGPKGVEKKGLKPPSSDH